MGDHHRRQSLLLVNDDACCDTPRKEREAVDDHATPIGGEHGVLQAEGKSLNHDGNHGTVTCGQAVLEPAAVDDLLDRCVDEEDHCSEYAYHCQHSNGKLWTGFCEYLFEILEYVRPEHEIRRSNQNDEQWNVCDDQP